MALRLTADAARAVDAYIEYDRIVGNADGGKTFTPEEYEAFKRDVAAKRADRWYVSWRCVSSGIDCKNVGPSTKCFCDHRYKEHDTDAADFVRCRAAGCKCGQFEYLPSHGTWAVKCNCKHDHDAHRPTGRKQCTKCACASFSSSFVCSCGRPWGDHKTVFEKAAERRAAGRPVDNLAGGGALYAAVGGVTDYSALADGIDREMIAYSGSLAPQLEGGPPRARIAGGPSAGPSGASSSSASSARIEVAAKGRSPLELLHRKRDSEPSEARPSLGAAPARPAIGGPPPRAAPAAAPPQSEAQAYAAKKQAAVERAAALRAERQAAAEEAELQRRMGGMNVR
eukprot:tig00020564_g11451.t1